MRAKPPLSHGTPSACESGAYACGFPLLCYLLTRAAHRKAGATDPPGQEASRGREGVGGGGEGGGGRCSVQRVRLLVRSYDARFWYWESLEVLRKRVPPVRRARPPHRRSRAPAAPESARGLRYLL